MSDKTNKVVYRVQGMHCSSCEALIEERIGRLDTVEKVRAIASQERVIIKYGKEEPRLTFLKKLFSDTEYSFSRYVSQKKSPPKLTRVVGLAILVIIVPAAFILLEMSGIAGMLDVTQSTSLPVFLLLGLVAGVSSCAALVGGLLVSLSKPWYELTGDANNLFRRIKPHLLFNISRILSYAFFGFLLGLLGSRVHLSMLGSSVLVFLVSALMLLLALQMLGVNKKILPKIPGTKKMAAWLSRVPVIRNRFSAPLIGAATFFVPCGFTLTVQSVALLAGNPVQSSAMLTAFAIGTALPLLVIGVASVKLYENKRLSGIFTRAAGLIVIFLVFFNVSSQLNVLGANWLPETRSASGVPATRESLSPEPDGINQLASGKTEDAEEQVASVDEPDGLPPVINGFQVVSMEAFSRRYSPNQFTVRLDVPVRWEIVDAGFSGCTNAIISRELFSGQIRLVRDGTAVAEFVPQNEGVYRFSCWMGHVSGTFEVIGAARN